MFKEEFLDFFKNTEGLGAIDWEVTFNRFAYLAFTEYATTQLVKPKPLLGNKVQYDVYTLHEIYNGDCTIPCHILNLT